MTSLLDELKEYLRIDGDDEETTLNTFIVTSKQMLARSGVKQPKDYYLQVNGEDVFAEHRLAVIILATHLYENRNAVTQNVKSKLPLSLETMILQLKWVDPDELSVQQ